MKLSVVIPAHNEEGSIGETVRYLCQVLNTNTIEHEILIINDHSTDQTGDKLRELSGECATVRFLDNQGPAGFGMAVRHGLDQYTGDCVAIMMADLSDDPNDLVKFYNAMVDGGYDAVFGSRFVKGGKVSGYPWLKLRINRMANFLVRALVGMRYNDTTNAFKLYRRSTIEGLKPFLAPHFNLTLELPLKAIVRGYSYAVVPNSWRNRKHGHSKLHIKEMGSRYFFILLYCLIEKFFSRGDYRKQPSVNR